MNVAISLALYLAICCKTLKEGGREGLRGGVSEQRDEKRLGGRDEPITKLPELNSLATDSTHTHTHTHAH